MAYFISFNQDFAVFIFQRILSLYNFLVLREMDKGFLTGMILAGLQKAFYMSDHTLPSQKNECIDFKESVIKWSQSYLSNRKFFVTLKDFF